MHLRHLDLNLLKAFDALMDERSVTRAAARLSLTQPAVSGILNRLRDSFGDPLFVRTPRGITPTPRALALTGPVKRVLADIEQLLTPTDFDPASAAFTVSVAATDYALRAVVAPFIAALRPRAPGIRVAVRPMDEADMQARMERGELDLALLTPESAPPDLHSRRLFDESYVCVLRAGHPQGAGPLDLDSFCALDHAIVSLQGGGFSGATDAALAQLGRTRRVMVSVPSFVMLLDLIRSTDLAALVPRRLLTDLQGLQALEAPLPIPGFTKLLTWHPRTHDDPGHRWVRGVMAEVCGVGDTPG
ncbi:LysR family transcriptional regulator [Zoogloea sp.]|uniref:LysR family transcriptional regulator n=1 Tax=Zoogloea sp. TaxID=49181 RepID=UPI0035AF33C1